VRDIPSSVSRDPSMIMIPTDRPVRSVERKRLTICLRIPPLSTHCGRGAGVSADCPLQRQKTYLCSNVLSALELVGEEGRKDLTGVRVFGSPCVPSLVSGIRMPKLPLLPLWEKGAGGMRGKRAPECRTSLIFPKNSTLESRGMRGKRAPECRKSIANHLPQCIGNLSRNRQHRRQHRCEVLRRLLQPLGTDLHQGFVRL